MDPFEEMLEAVAFRFNNRVKKACEPVFRYFGMNSFWYYRVKEDGQFIYFGSSVPFDEYYASEKFYLNYPYYRHPKYFQNSISLMRAVPDRNVSQVLDYAVHQHHFYNSLVLINKIERGMEVFGFSFTSMNESHYMMALNELPLLRLFTRRFWEENSFLVSKIEDNQINLAEIVGLTFYQESVPVVHQPVSPRETFLKQMGIVNPLSEGESRVIRLLLEGYSASQIASHIYRSKRTVEHRIERMKEKLGCESKAELVQKARELEHFGYFLP